MASYPVPGAEYRDFELMYAVLSDGRIMYHDPEAGFFAPLTRADYDQYEAVYPDGPKMDPAFLADADADHFGKWGVEDGTVSEAGSDVFCEPDAALQHDDDPFRADGPACVDAYGAACREPFARPTNPTPSKGNAISNRGINEDDNPDLETTQFRPRVLFPSPSSYTTRAQAPTNTTMPGPEPSALATPPRAETDAAENYDGDFIFTPSASPSPAAEPSHPASPYHTRRSPISWTGLDESAWSRDFYLDCAGTMGVRHEWEAATGVSHGMLSHCGWVGYDAANRGWIVPAAAGVELTVTTPEGQEYWLDDCVQQYEEVRGVMDREYGHRCGEACVGFFESFGWELFPEAQDLGAKLVASLDAAAERVGESESEGDELEDDGEGVYQWTMLETIVEEDEDEVDEDDEVMSEVDLDMGFLDRLADVVLAAPSRVAENVVGAGSAQEKESGEEKKGREEKAGENGGVKELPRWMRDPSYVSGMSWADMMDEEDEL